jgi:small-conductance mechanosensitive channel
LEYVKRALGYLAIFGAILLGVGASFIRQTEPLQGTIFSLSANILVIQTLSIIAVSIGIYGVYVLVTRVLVSRTTDKRRRHDLRNVLQFVFIVAALAGTFAVLTQQWVGLLVSLGVVGFAATFALQQPLFSLTGWIYIMVKRPYGVGDRVEIEGSKGDVVDVDFFVTTLWEINGGVVSSNQPSGRVVTLPNSVVLSSHVHNYSYQDFPHIWNELTVQVAYETDLEFARGLMIDEADDYLGDEMQQAIQRYRKRLSETPVELEVRDRPTVNINQQESWVELKLRYLVHPRRGQSARNELYERILDQMHRHPDRVAFPVSRNR